MTESPHLFSEKQQTSNTAARSLINQFQAMARIMAILCEGGRLQKGSQRYKIARKMIATKIDRMGPDAAYSKAKWNKHELLVQIEELNRLSRLGRF